MGSRFIHIYCGDGKGKTAAVMGQAIRDACAEKTVFFIQYLKGEQSESEKVFYQRMEPEIKFFRFDKYPRRFENLTPEEKEEECRNFHNGLNFAKKVLVTEECDILVLDEILGLVESGIISVQELREVINSCSDRTVLYLTGQYSCREIWGEVDEVTEVITRVPEK